MCGSMLGDGDLPVQVVVLIDVGVSRQAQIFAPALHEAAPEEIADRDLVSFLVTEGFAHPVDFGEGVRLFVP